MTIIKDLNEKISNLEKNIHDETIQLKSYQNDSAILQGKFNQKFNELNKLFILNEIPFEIIYDDRSRFIKLVIIYNQNYTVSSIHICSRQIDKWIKYQFKLMNFYKIITKTFLLRDKSIKFCNTNNNFLDFKVTMTNYISEFHLNENLTKSDIEIKYILNDCLYSFTLPLDNNQMLTFKSKPYIHDLGRTESIPHTAFHVILSKKLTNISFEQLTNKVNESFKELHEKSKELRN